MAVLLQTREIMATVSVNQKQIWNTILDIDEQLYQ